MAKIKVSSKRKIQERRKAQRLDLPIRVKYNLLPKKRILQETFSQNVSGGGIRLKLGYPLKKGHRLKTMLYFPQDARPITAFSKVVWCRRIAAEKKKPVFNMGLQYIRIIPKDRQKFVFLFCEMMINYFMQGKFKI